MINERELELCRSMVAALPAPAILLDETFKICMINRAAEKMTGHNLDSTIGQEMGGVLPAEIAQRCQDAMKRLGHQGHETLPGIRLKDSAGTSCLWDADVQSYCNIEWKITGYSLVLIPTSSKRCDSNVSADVRALVDTVTKGKLTGRLDERKYQDTELVVAKDINKILDSIATPCHLAIQALNELAEGRLPQPVDKQWEGEFLELKIAINKVNQQVSQRSKDIEMLIEAALDGKLDVRADITTYSGYNGKQVGGINSMLDTVCKPLKVAEQSFDRLAEGSLPERINENWRGDFDRLRNSINMVVDVVGMRTKDVEMLIQAVAEGRLEKRADLSKYHGYNAKFVGGINSMLDNAMVPVHDAMRVSEAYASGDLTARMEVDCKGDFDEFAQALDRIGENLTDLVREMNKSIVMVSSTSQELASSTEEMNASTEQVSSAIQQISRGAQNQSQQITETAKLMAEFTDNVNTVVERSTLAIDSAKKANSSAMHGGETVQKTISKMQEVQKVVTDAAKVIESLGKRSEEIGQIVDVITNISDQTNLLALNAAIEAARAGEQGRGFAVVAEEVKNLAEDSREAAERIAKMIKEVQTETSKAVLSMEKGTKETAAGMAMVDQTGNAFREINDLAAKTVEEVVLIGTQMEGEKKLTLGAAKSVDGIASIAEQTASASEESASSTEELTASMEDMTARAQALSEMAIEMQKLAARFDTGDMTPEVKEAMTPSKNAPKPKAKDAGRLPAKVSESLKRRGVEVHGQ